MEMSTLTQPEVSKLDFQEFQTSTTSERQRQRSARRLRHEAEALVFQKQAGDLEAIRKGLGLRPSQMAELLRVHPSAWTRWTKTGRVPPHILRMLEWYLELHAWRTEKAKALTSPGPQLTEALVPLPAEPASKPTGIDKVLWIILLTQTLVAVGILGVLIFRSGI